MDEKTFWDLIAAGVREEGDYEDKLEALEGQLRLRPLAEIEGFYLCYDELVTAAWRPELVLVAFLANHHGGNGRCHAEDFLAFVCWLIDQGPRVYAAALRDPDSLADHPDDPPWQSEGLWAAATVAWEIARGGGSFYEAISGRASGPADLPSGGVVKNAELARRFPRLARRFLEGKT